MKTKNQIEIAYIPLDKLLLKTVKACPTENIYCSDSIDTGQGIICDKAQGQACPDRFYFIL